MKRVLSVGAVSALVLGAAVLSAQPAQAVSPPSYSVMLLQPNNNGQGNSFANGLNNRGDVVGYSSAALYQGSSLWRARSGHGVGIRGIYSDMADGISGQGVVVGHDATGDNYWRAANGTVEQIAVDGLTHDNSMSESGAAALNVHTSNTLWIATSPTALTELLPPAGTTEPRAEGISENGRLVAGSAINQGTTVPVLWTDGAASRLQTPSGAADSRLEAVNNSGVAAGCSVINSVERPFRYNATGAPTALPVLAGYTNTCATVINNASTVAGTASNSSGAGAAVVWVNGQAHNLNNLVAQRTGYTLTSVSDINASGQIVGTAVLDDGSARGYIATPSTAESIYTAPGYHDFNGRQWRTTCEPYSQTTRCRTEIWATTVKTANGHHTRVTDWAFNNLTYLPSPRSLWKDNPLGNTGEWTAADGRAWRTECDTAATGRNGCRSYANVTVVEAVPNPAGGYTFRQENKFVFNNIVRFS